MTDFLHPGGGRDTVKSALPPFQGCQARLMSGRHGDR